MYSIILHIRVHDIAHLRNCSNQACTKLRLCHNVGLRFEQVLYLLKT